MSFSEPIRIVSDLHFGHPAGLIEEAAQLAPLLKDSATMLFNGDTVEMRFEDERETAGGKLAEIAAVCRDEGVAPLFINGNHDPFVSGYDHADLADGGVLVTHGDLLFHDISPWSREGEHIGRAHTRVLEEFDEDAFCDFEKRLRAGKQAALAIETLRSDLEPGSWAKLSLFLREAWPPWRPLQIVKVWIDTPSLAVALARVFRPRARVICVGHVHWSGIWRIGPRIVVNTGSFIPGSGRLMLELEGGALNVHEIVRRRGEFHIGKRRARLDAQRLRASEGY